MIARSVSYAPSMELKDAASASQSAAAAAGMRGDLERGGRTTAEADKARRPRSRSPHAHRDQLDDPQRSMKGKQRASTGSWNPDEVAERWTPKSTRNSPNHRPPQPPTSHDQPKDATGHAGEDLDVEAVPQDARWPESATGPASGPTASAPTAEIPRPTTDSPRRASAEQIAEQVGPPMPPVPPPPPLDPSTAPGTAPAPAPAALQSILKRPAPARLSSSYTSRRSFSASSPLASLLPGPDNHPNAARPATATSPQDPVRLSPPLSRPPPGRDARANGMTRYDTGEEDDDDDKSKSDGPPLVTTHGVLFSTPGTTTSVLPLSSPSLAESRTFHLGQLEDHPVDHTGTFKSWKSSMMGRRSGMYDRKKLAALGFEEELTRDYDFWASWGIALCNIGGLPGTVLGVLTALETGGGSMYAIAWPLSGLFMIAAAAVLGEMASTWPVAGAMFTWAFRLCRSRKALNPWARYISWITGSLLLCSHILLQIVVTWQFAHNFKGVVGLYTEKEYSHWVTIALGWGIITIAAVIVSSKLSRSPRLWRICGYLILAFFFIINIILLTTATEIRSARYVFTSYRNTTGFENRSYVYMIGWVLTCIATGMEASAHMAEDTKRPSRTVPLAMFWSVLATYLMGWVSICVLLATMNTDGLDSSLQPSIALIANSIPRGYTTAILIFVLFGLLFQTVAQLMATSRFIWALSRESALPFSNFFRRLSKKHRTPIPAIIGTWAVVMPALCLIAVNVSILATTMLEGAGITGATSYFLPLVLYLVCPKDVLRGDGRAQWTLRGMSQVLTVPAAVFLGTVIICMCLPTQYPLTTLTISWASPVLVGVLILSSLSWMFYGNRRYAGPIKTMTRWTIGAEVDLPSTSSAGAAGGGAAKKSTAVKGHATTTAQLGRSAHVWATSGDYAADAEHESAETGAWTDGTASRATRRSTETGSAVTGIETGSSEYTSDDDEEEDDEEDGGSDSAGHADGEESATGSLSKRRDEEGRIGGHHR